MAGVTVRPLTWSVLGLVLTGAVRGQEAASGVCYGAGSIAMAVIFTFLGTLLLVGLLLYFLKRRADANRDNHLILETDPERGGKADYAFDNPGFKDATLIATKTDNTTKSIWAPIFSMKTEKKRPQDDSALQSNEVKVVALKSQDFTGLGFNISGNMKDGIYIRDILHRGPAFESGKLNPGDRIQSVTISFEHMVYEDALNILSYASPYEVMIEAKGGRLGASVPGQGHQPLVHPAYRSSSALDLTAYFYPEKTSKKKLFGDDHSSSSNYSSLQKSRSNVTTLERKESKSPRPISQPKSAKKTTPEMHLRAHLQLPIEEVSEKSPKIVEQNQNNANIEIMKDIRGIDEVDQKKPEVKRREKKPPEFERHDSGIRRDVNGIPLEVPEHMQEAANYAKRNRKSEVVVNGYDDRRSSKTKAPSPPTEVKFTLGPSKAAAFEDLSTLGTNESYASDSEDERNNVSVNTIELNSSDVVIHQMEEEERKSRKTASTGDLTKMKKTSRSNTGTLERAQSLDITDTSGPSLGMSHAYDARENLLIDREPRLSLILDGLNTFQRDRLKNSTEWGNLEDAILSLNREDEEERRKSEPQFNAVMDRVIQIKRESQEIELPEEVVREFANLQEPKKGTTVVNKLWPDNEEMQEQQQEKPAVPERTKLKVADPPQPPERVSVEYQCIKPVPPKRERTPEKETTVINLSDKLGPPVTSFEKQNITEMCSQIAKGRNGDCKMIKDEWEVDNLHNTSPPGSLMDEVLESYNKNYGNVTVVQTAANLPDETKRVQNATEDFIFNERNAASESLTNIPDDVKVAKMSDDRVSISQGSNLHSLELSINNPEEPVGVSNDVTVILTKPDRVTVKKIETGPAEVAVTETAFTTQVNHGIPVAMRETKQVKVSDEDGHDDKFKVEITQSKYSTFEVDKPLLNMDALQEPLAETVPQEVTDFKGIEDESPALSLTDAPPKTYVTEIQVSPHVSEVLVNTPTTPKADDPLENAFENYVKNFERKLDNFESNIQNFENNLEDFVREPSKSPPALEEQTDVEKQVSKIQELAEEQLKTLPEMRFTTSSYESAAPGSETKTPEKRHSFELLRSNFEKASGSPPRRGSITPPKSRIPIATTISMKTPPMSPERRDSKNLENENDKAILELMSSGMHPTAPSKIKPPGKTGNVSVTSIRNNSKIPSGLPTLASRPPIPPRKTEEQASNGGVESSFKQWVFSPNNNVTNVIVGKEK